MDEKFYTIAVSKDHSALQVLMTLRSVAGHFGAVKVVSHKNRQALRLDPYDHGLTRMFIFADEKLSNDQTIVELSSETDLKGFSVAMFFVLALVFIWTIIGPIIFIMAVLAAYAAGSPVMEKICKETERRFITPLETATHIQLNWEAKT